MTAVTSNNLGLLGLALRAGKLEIGEEPVGNVCRARRAKVVLLASDAADNTVRRAEQFSRSGNAPCVTVPFTKAELGAGLGRTSCAMLALTDNGLAANLVEKLAGSDPERYGETAAQLSAAAGKTLQRQKEKAAHERNVRNGRKKPWAPPPKTREKA